jgi:hypothetical protein
MLRWFLALVGSIIVWLAVAVALDHGPSGLLFGAALGSATTRDPLFLVAILMIGMAFNRPYQVALAAGVLTVVYTWVVSESLDRSPTSMTYLGRFLSSLFWGSLIATVRIAVLKSETRETA